MRYSAEKIEINMRSRESIFTIYPHFALINGAEMNKLGVAVFLLQKKNYKILRNEILSSFPCSPFLPHHKKFFFFRENASSVDYIEDYTPTVKKIKSWVARKERYLTSPNRSVKPDERAVWVLDKLESQKNVLICYLPGLCGFLRRPFISWLNSSILSVILPSLAAIVCFSSSCWDFCKSCNS